MSVFYVSTPDLRFVLKRLTTDDQMKKKVTDRNKMEVQDHLGFKFFLECRQSQLLHLKKNKDLFTLYLISLFHNE